MKGSPPSTANLFAQYLGASPADSLLEDRYIKAVDAIALTDSEKEAAILSMVLKYPLLLPLVDSGLTYLNSSHSLRRRIIIMSALMETDTRYTHLFLQSKTSSFPVLSFIYRASIAGIKTLAGILLLKITGWS